MSATSKNLHFGAIAPNHGFVIHKGILNRLGGIGRKGMQTTKPNLCPGNDTAST